MFEEEATACEWAISWRNVSVSVRSRNPKWFGRNPQPLKRLVSNVTGAIRSGSLVVLMGPSGAGKSTLMGALAHRSASDVVVEGDVRMGGAPVSRFVHRMSGFMHQEDMFVETLTVGEHLHLMAKLKSGRRRKGKEVERMVERVMREMGLWKCAERRIGGGGGGKGISGGERKLLAFATEVLTDPPILFCDEPTTGLDSYSAQYLVSLMKRMTSQGRKTILCTIHQPSSELFSMFEQLILLADGRTAFIGSADSALDFLQKNGISCPSNYNPAEIIIEALSVSSGREGDARVKKLCDEYSVCETASRIEVMLAEPGHPTLTEDRRQKAALDHERPPWVTTLFWLTYRSFLQVVRDPSVQIVRILQKLAIALMAGLCFLGTVGLTQAGIQSVQGAIFLLVTENTFPPMYGVLSLFPDEFPLFLREYRSDLYSPHQYYFAKIISFLPGLILEPILFVAVAYLIAGLRQTLHAFLLTTAIAILTTNVATACGCFFSNAFSSVSMSLAILVPIDYTLMVTSGLFVKLTSLPPIISWFRHLSWFMYANEALSIVQWEGVRNITCEYDNPEVPCLEDGSEVLQKFDFSSSRLSQDILAMGVLYCVFHVLAYVSLRWKTNKNS